MIRRVLVAAFCAFGLLAVTTATATAAPNHSAAPCNIRCIEKMGSATVVPQCC